MEQGTKFLKTHNNYGRKYTYKIFKERKECYLTFWCLVFEKLICWIFITIHL